jgi:plastocyanin
MNKLYNTFEKQLREKMAGHEMPYDPRDWNDLQSTLNPKGRSTSALLVALFASFAFVGGASAFIYSTINKNSTAKLASNQVLGLHDSQINTYQNLQYLPQSSPSIETTDSDSNPSNPLNSGKSNSLASGPMQSLISTNDADSGTAQSLETTTIPANHVEVPSENIKKKLAFAPSVSMACAGTAVEFKVTSLPDGVSGNYIWNFGDGKFKAETAPSNVYTKPGHYDVSLSITDDNGRITTTVMSKAIVIVPTPKADFNWHFINDDPSKPSVQISNNSVNATAAEWTMKDGEKISAINPSFEVINKGKQMIALQVTNEYGCSNGTVKYISVNSDINLGAATSLKLGKETFLPEGLKSNKHNFELTVFNSQGQAVYTTTSRGKGWDGSLSTGGAALAGESYQWRVIISNDLTKEEKYFNGTLQIIP